MVFDESCFYGFFCWTYFHGAFKNALFKNDNSVVESLITIADGRIISQTTFLLSLLMEPVEVSNDATPFFRSPRSQHQGCPVDPNHHPSKAGALTNLKTLGKENYFKLMADLSLQSHYSYFNYYREEN